MWSWPRLFHDMHGARVLLFRHQICRYYVVTFRSIHWGGFPWFFFSFERVAQFNLEWIFSKLDSGFQSLVVFRILSAGFRIPKPRIPDSTSKKFVDSGIRIPLHGAKIFSKGPIWLNQPATLHTFYRKKLDLSVFDLHSQISPFTFISGFWRATPILIF